MFEKFRWQKKKKDKDRKIWDFLIATVFESVPISTLELTTQTHNDRGSRSLPFHLQKVHTIPLTHGAHNTVFTTYVIRNIPHIIRHSIRSILADNMWIYNTRHAITPHSFTSCNFLPHATNESISWRGRAYFMAGLIQEMHSHPDRKLEGNFLGAIIKWYQP